MTKIEVINALKTELNKTYTVRVTHYKDGKIVKVSNTEHPNMYLGFNRPVIEAALKLLEEQYDI